MRCSPCWKTTDRTLQNRRRVALLAIYLPLCGFFACAPSTPEPEHPDPPVHRTHASADIDAYLARRGQTAQYTDVNACVADMQTQTLCHAGNHPLPRRIPIRIALDPRYENWPNAMDRLARTVSCVNVFYEPAGIEWDVEEITPWDPGQQRHYLYPLLARLQHDFPADLKSMVVGITVWEERRIYSSGGSEIGLSQKAACVVPSWPRIENDCVILAHELGHLVGARHVPGKHWIMGWAASPFHLPAKDPLQRVVSLYRFHPRNIAAMRVFAQGEFTALGLHPGPTCGTQIEQIDRCYGL